MLIEIREPTLLPISLTNQKFSSHLEQLPITQQAPPSAGRTWLRRGELLSAAAYMWIDSKQMWVCSLNGSKRKVHTIPTLPPIPLLPIPALAAPLMQCAYIKPDLAQLTYVLTCSFSCLHWNYLKCFGLILARRDFFFFKFQKFCQLNSFTHTRCASVSKLKQLEGRRYHR